MGAVSLVYCPACGAPGRVEVDWRGDVAVVCAAYRPCEEVAEEEAAFFADLALNEGADDFALNEDAVEDEAAGWRRRLASWRAAS